MRRTIVAGLCALLILLSACAPEAPSGGEPSDASVMGAGSGGSVVEYDGWVYFLSTDMTGVDAANLQALPPGETTPVLWPEAGYVQSIYAVGSALYFSRYDGTLICPAGGGEMTAFVPGMLADFDELEGAFYFTCQGQADAGLYRIAPDGGDDRQLYDGACAYLAHTEDAVYFYTQDGQTLTLYRVNKDGSGLTVLSSDPVYSDYAPNCVTIPSFALCDGWLIWSQGEYQGSLGIFYGQLLCMRPDGSDKSVLRTHGIDRFTVSDGWIYYDNYHNMADKDAGGLSRIRPDRTEPQFVCKAGPNITLADGALYYSDGAALRTSGCDGLDARPLFDGSEMAAEYAEVYVSSPLCSPTAILGDWVYFTAEVYGYPPGSSWRGATLVSRFYRVRKDGGQLQLLHEKDYLRDGYLYFHRDDAVNAAVEQILGRTVDTLSRADLETLAATEALAIEGKIETLADLRGLFPNLKFLRLTLNQGGLDAAACAVLDALPHLRGISIRVGGDIAALDFLDGLTYVELNGVDFSAAALFGAAVVRDHMTVTVGTYVRILDGAIAYELMSARVEDDQGEFSEHETRVFVSQKGAGGYALQTVIEEDGVANGTGLILCDVDFDGEKDLLVMLGHFGAQGLVRYACYLRRGEGFVPCPSFADIPNPSVDAAGQKILSTWRNWAASHSWAMHEFQNGAFVRTDCLTGEVALEYEDEEVWRYTDEGLVDGVWQTRKVLNTIDNTRDEIWEEIYADGGYWGLMGDRWNTLYNGGSMVDFSIYGDGLGAMESALLGE